MLSAIIYLLSLNVILKTGYVVEAQAIADNEFDVCIAESSYDSAVAIKECINDDHIIHIDKEMCVLLAYCVAKEKDLIKGQSVLDVLKFFKYIEKKHQHVAGVSGSVMKTIIDDAILKRCLLLDTEHDAPPLAFAKYYNCIENYINDEVAKLVV